MSESIVLPGIEPGIYSNQVLSNEAYHADREYVSSSGLKMLPYRTDEFIARYQMTQKAESRSEALKFGGGLHSAILEPDIFPTEYVVEPVVNKRTNDGKAELLAFYKSVEAEGKTVLTPDDMDLIRAMRNTVNQHPIAGKALMGAVMEQSFFHAGDLLKQKVRTDAFKNNIIMDLKSCENIDKFHQSVAEYGYNFSEAMYKTVISDVINEPVHFLFIAVQKSYPFTVSVFESDDEMKSEGYKKYIAAVETYAELKETGKWAEIRSMSLPNWAKPKDNF